MPSTHMKMCITHRMIHNRYEDTHDMKVYTLTMLNIHNTYKNMHNTPIKMGIMYMKIPTTHIRICNTVK